MSKSSEVVTYNNAALIKKNLRYEHNITDQQETQLQMMK
jgi:hypothetical protein